MNKYQWYKSSIHRYRMLHGWIKRTKFESILEQMLRWRNQAIRQGKTIKWKRIQSDIIYIYMYCSKAHKCIRYHHTNMYYRQKK